MKVFFVVTVARQVDGEIVSIRFEKAYVSLEKANDYALKLARVFTENVQTPAGPVQFMCERGVHEIELEE